MLKLRYVRRIMLTATLATAAPAAIAIPVTAAHAEQVHCGPNGCMIRIRPW